jgi:hypothetical protein
MKKETTEKLPFTKKEGNANIIERLRLLDKKQRHAALATVSGDLPYTSLVAYALTPDLKGALFGTPRKTGKYKNMITNRNVSLLIDTRSNSSRGYMKSEAVTILGTAVPVRKGRKWKELAPLLIKKHPQLEDFINAPSTALVHVSFRKVLHAGSFQRVTVWDVE